jgi:hypothetical protein
MSPAVIAFIGVIVGALATTASTWFFSKREERRESKVAMRLIREDVILAGSTLQSVLKNGWFPEFALPLEDWREHRAVLARDLSDGDWDAVAMAMGYLDRIEAMLNSVSGGGEIKPEQIPEDAKDVIAATVDSLKKANEVLRPKARPVSD